MSKIAIYPGTFDPITFGHIDVIKKSLKLFDKIVVAVSDESKKNYLFSPDERIEIVNKALFTILILSSELNKYFLLLSSETATTILSNNFNDFFITSICPKVIGSNVPG